VSARALAAVAYVAVAGLWIYGVADRGWDIPDMIVLAVLIVAQVAAGALLRWWALLLPAAAVVLAIPAGYSDADASGEIPIWISVLFGGIFALPLILAGILTNSYLRRIRAARVQSLR
jgi:hypothetical protein